MRKTDKTTAIAIQIFVSRTFLIFSFFNFKFFVSISLISTFFVSIIIPLFFNFTQFCFALFVFEPFVSALFDSTFYLILYLHSPQIHPQDYSCLIFKIPIKNPPKINSAPMEHKVTAGIVICITFCGFKSPNDVLPQMIQATIAMINPVTNKRKPIPIP